MPTVKQSKVARKLLGEIAYRGVLKRDILARELDFRRRTPDLKGLGYGKDGMPHRTDHQAGHEIVFIRDHDGYFQVFFLDGYMCMLSEHAAIARLTCHRDETGMPIRAGKADHARAAQDYSDLTGGWRA